MAASSPTPTDRHVPAVPGRAPGVAAPRAAGSGSATRVRDPRRLGALRLALLLATAAGAGGVHGQETIFNGVVDPDSGTRVEVVSIFDELPAQGFAPLRITITNRTNADRTWRLSSRASFNRWMGSGNVASTFTGSFPLTAEANSVAVHTVLAPIPTAFQSGGYGGSRPDLQVSLGSPGMEDASGYKYSEGNNNWPCIAISAALASRSMTDLRDEIQKTSGRSNFFGSTYDPDMLPADWRAYSGFDVLMIADEEWLDADPGARTAVLEWVHLGGQLHLYAGRSGVSLSELGVSAPGGAREATAGLGRMAVFEWDGNVLAAPETVAGYEKLAGLRRIMPVSEGYNNSRWALFRSLGTRSFGSWQVALILIAFGILVGPINLFVFAKAGQRHRMFFTTPIISLGASLILIVLIFLQDGSGGKGFRFGFLTLDPAGQRAYLIQEQLARTGVLFRNAFDTGEPIAISPVMTPPSRWAFLSDSGTSRALDYSGSGSRLDGDWFQSRSEQGHQIMAVRTTRARVEDLGSQGGTPLLKSEFDLPLADVHYIAPDGTFWKSTGMAAPGGEIALESSSREELDKWLSGSAASASEWLRERIQQLPGERPRGQGVFFASVPPEAGTSTALIPTLVAIEWSDASLVVHGTVAPAAAPTDTSN